MAKSKTPAKKKAAKKEAPEAEVVQQDQSAPEVNNKALVIQDEAPAPAGEPEVVDRDSMLSIVGTVTTADLKKALETQTEQRQLIQDFIKKHLKEGTDYGKIHVVKNCPMEDKARGSCDRDYHYSKPILFKPGQEKIFSLFGITDKLEKDVDAYEMLPGVVGLVAYKCTMFQKGKVIGEGRGAATLGSERSDPNSTIKKAEKRARMDACLSLGFSEYFTQDLDDPEYASQREMANEKARAEAERRDKDEFGLMPRDPDAPIDNSERAVLHRILVKAGFTDPDEILELLRANGVAEPTSMTSGQAREMMGKISHGIFAKPEMPAPEPVYDDSETQLPPEPEIDVDDDFKAEVQSRAETIGLNSRGMMWLMQRIAGKPFAKWDRLTDDEWRKAYDVVMAILDGKLDVDDHHVAGVIPMEEDQPSED